MNFRYKKYAVKPDNCPLPQKKHSLRPVIQIAFHSLKDEFAYLVLIDSGADYCMFHALIGERLGLNVKNGKCLTFTGTSGNPQLAYFHRVKFLVGGIEHECLAGFSYDMNTLPYGLLGQDGFFDKWHVKFEYNKENIELKETA